MGLLVEIVYLSWVSVNFEEIWEHVQLMNSFGLINCSLLAAPPEYLTLTQALA